MKKTPLKDDLMTRTDHVHLYHATPFLNQILTQGFKTRKELCGIEVLGGCDNGEFIAFTSSPVIASDIAKDIQTISDIANHKITLENIAEELDKRDYETEPYYQQFMMEKPSEIWNRIIKEREDLDKYDPIPIQLKRKYPNGKDEEIILGSFNKYLGKREDQGGRANPDFVHLSAKPFQKPDVNVGVVETEINLPKLKSYRKNRKGEYKLEEIDPTLPNLWEDPHVYMGLSLYDYYKFDRNDLSNTYKTPTIRTSDDYLREIKVNRKLIPCEKPTDSIKQCQNFKAFDFNQIDKETYEEKDKEDELLEYALKKNKVNDVICEKIDDIRQDKFIKREKGWYREIKNRDTKVSMENLLIDDPQVKQQYAITMEFLLRNDPESNALLESILPDVKKRVMIDHTPVNKRIWEEFLLQKDKCDNMKL